MRLWALIGCVALALSACALGAAVVGEQMPTFENDHLLDGVPGLRGPGR